jgi:phage gp36-like protein
MESIINEFQMTKYKNESEEVKASNRDLVQALEEVAEESIALGVIDCDMATLEKSKLAQ